MAVTADRPASLLIEAQYGLIAPDILLEPAEGPVLSPYVAGAQQLEDLEPASLAGLTVLAPPGTLERAYVLALSLTRLAPGGRLLALAPKDKGGSRLRKELEAFGCQVQESARRHHRLCLVQRPAELVGLEQALQAGAPQWSQKLGLWTQPGIFSWDRMDPGTEQLLTCLPPFKGEGADLGCGLGALGHAVLASTAVRNLVLLDYDRRAIDCARRNVDDPRVSLLHADVRAGTHGLTGLDFIVMNPPFHDGGREDRRLGPLFIERSAAMLRKGGACWLVANVALPYEGVLTAAFSRFKEVRKANGYKVIEAIR